MVGVAGLLSSLAILSPGVAPVPEVVKADGLIVVTRGDHLRFLNEAGREVRRFTPPKPEGWPAWQIGPISPDGTQVILTATVGEMSYRRMVIARVDGKEPLRLIEPPGGAPSEVLWAPDGKHLIYTRSVDDGAFGVGYHHVNLKYSLEGRKVEVMALPGIEGGPPQMIQPQSWGVAPEDYRRSLHQVIAVSRDGASYLTYELERAQYGAPLQIAWVSHDGKSVQRPFKDPRYSNWFGVFSPDQKQVLFPVWIRSPNPNFPDRFDGVFVVTSGEARQECVIDPPADMARLGQVRVAWSPDGKRIAFGYHRITNDGKFEFRVQSFNPDGTDPRTVFSVVGTAEEVRPYRLDGWR